MSLTLNSAFLGKASVRPAAMRPMTSSGNATRSVTCMAKKKGIRVIVTLECTEARSEGGTPSRVRVFAVFRHMWENSREFAAAYRSIRPARFACADDYICHTMC